VFYNRKVAFSALLISREVGTMKNKRFQFGDRRENNDKPRAPFKDSNGKLILGCRRQIPDRRMNSKHGEWIEEIVIR